MRYLVTGGAGFIGANFIRYWLDHSPDDSIVNLDALTYAGDAERLADYASDQRYRFVHGSILDAAVVQPLVEESDAIIHFAAESHVDRSIKGPSIFVETNVSGTQVLLEAARQAGNKRFHHISCYDEQTRAYTKQGFKTFQELTQGELVLSINPENQHLEWKPIEKIIVQDYNGPMIQVKNRTLDLLVTPNHRMLIQHKKSKKYFFREAQDLQRFAISKLPKQYIWAGASPDQTMPMNISEEFMYLLGIFIGDGCLAYQEKRQTSKSGLKKQELMAIGRNQAGQFFSTSYIGEEKTVVSKAWRVFVDVPTTDECRERCEETLIKLGIRWHAHSGRAGEHIYFTSKALFPIFQMCGKGAKQKRIPDWALELPPQFLLPLFEGLMDSDGSGRRVFWTSSVKLAHQFMELSIKLGFSPTLGARHSRSFYQGRKIEGDSFVISLGRQWRDIRKQSVSEVNYDGKIWCLKVKDNHNFLVERGGRTLFCGNTDEVFGALNLDEARKFTEETAYDPRSPYSATKAGSDHLVRAYYHTYGLPITISNCANNYGPWQAPDRLIPLFIWNALHDQPLPIYGDGKAVREHLHVIDHYRGIKLILEQGKIGQTYCIGADNEKSILEVADAVLTATGKSESLKKFVADRPGHDRRYAIDYTKIKSELGYEPSIKFEQGIAETVDWYRKHADWTSQMAERAADFKAGFHG